MKGNILNCKFIEGSGISTWRKEWWIVMMKGRASFVQNSITMEEHTREFKETLNDDQESFLSVFLFQFFPKNLDKEQLVQC